MKWTQPICGRCFKEQNPGRPAVSVVDAEKERCCECGSVTSEGIYVRRDPRVVRFPKGGAQ